ncbi:M23 family metallopeptidase [Gracilimonas sp.]|uniref:M23 family metallopeptidase n=1 Tax=Gracilimonas sp. TaxID=1974203 RepID=UPI00287260ED|nr:M23 family metallopeptidase [Gracilimonas sp.]
MKRSLWLIFLSTLFLFQPYGINNLLAQASEEIEAVVLYPVMNTTFTCAEHAEGELTNLGDAYGRDCMVIRNDTTRLKGHRIPSLFKNNGLNNEDWFGWEVPVLAPFDGTVTSVNINDLTNQPGKFPDRTELEGASEIRFSCENGVQVVYAHIRNPDVESGQSVKSGQEVALIGNNAVSTAPHIHLGAWRDKTPLQIRFDLRALGKIRGKK